jgi:hypothetical protein
MKQRQMRTCARMDAYTRGTVLQAFLLVSIKKTIYICFYSDFNHPKNIKNWADIQI